MWEIVCSTVQSSAPARMDQSRPATGRSAASTTLAAAATSSAISVSGISRNLLIWSARALASLRAVWVVMGGSVRALRWRRRRYALRARFYRVLRFTGPIIELPGDWHLERQEFWFWRVRLALWAMLAAVGWLVLGWPGAVLGVVAGLLTEAAFSYRLV